MSETRTRRRGGRLFLLFALILAGLLLGIPPLARWGLPALAARHGIALSVGEARVDLFSAKLRLRDVRTPRVSAKDLILALDPVALVTGSPVWSRVELRQGRVDLPRGATPAGLAQDFPVSSWVLAHPVDDLRVSDLEVRVEGQALALHVQGLRLRDFPGTQGAASVPMELTIGLGEGRLRYFGRVWPYPTEPELQGELELIELPLAPFLQAAGMREVEVASGRLSGRVNLQVRGLPRGAGVSARFSARVSAQDLWLRLPGGLRMEAQTRWDGVGELAYGEDGQLVQGSVAGQLFAERLGLTGVAQDPAIGLRWGLAHSVDLGGKLRWRSTSQSWGLTGDGTALRLDLEPRRAPSVALQGIRFWGLENQAEGAWRLGGLRIGHAERQPPPASRGATPVEETRPEWRLDDLQAEGLRWDPGKGLGAVGVRSGHGQWPLPSSGGRHVHLDGAEASRVHVERGGWSAGDLVLRGVGVEAGGSHLADGLSLREVALIGVEGGGTPALAARRLRLVGLDAGLARRQEGGWQSALEEVGLGLARLGVGLDQVELAGDSRLVISDYSVEPRLRLEVQDVQARLGAWHSLAGSADAALHLSGWAGEHGRVSLDGRLRPLPRPELASLGLVFEGLDLAAFSGYAVRDLEGRIRSGELSGRIGWGASGRTLALRLRRPVLDGPRRSRVLLALLEDSEGRVRLVVNESERSSDHPLLAALIRAAREDYRPLGLTDGDLRDLLGEQRTDLHWRHSDTGEGPPEDGFLEALADRVRRHPALRVGLCQGPSLAGVRKSLVERLGVPPARLRPCTASGAGIELRVELKKAP